MKFSILGTNIDDLNSYRETYELLLNYLKTQNEPAYLTVNNVHTVTEGLKDNKFREIVNNSFLALPDGKPLSVIGKWKGAKKTERIFGPTFFEKVLEWGVEENLKHYFWGNRLDTLDKLIKNAEKRFSGIKIAGASSPPFRELLPSENDQYLENINNSGADIVWISLGAPKQEKWIYSNYKSLNKGVMVGIGAGFDYLAENLKNAPGWMKDFSLEWLYRLKQEPRRLWKRYLISNSKFIYYAALELLGLKKFS
jgi:N-acetylglucosaminyldiphosphoundecaprenol N-acetyl-beta-D-mannosaminyltransferase